MFIKQKRKVYKSFLILLEVEELQKKYIKAQDENSKLTRTLL